MDTDKLAQFNGWDRPQEKVSNMISLRTNPVWKLYFVFV
jgi:hypothetical protein